MYYIAIFTMQIYNKSKYIPTENINNCQKLFNKLSTLLQISNFK